MTEPTRLAVLGAPIGHSKSPLLHAAAYASLGLDWVYGRAEVEGSDLPGFIDGCDTTWRGLSLTMPLKRDILPLLDTVDPLVSLTGAANTVLFEAGEDGVTERTLHGFNTDVYGVTQSLREAGLAEVNVVHLLGAGATASSVLVAVVELGARAVVVFARTPEKAAPLLALGELLGISITVQPLWMQDRSSVVPDLVASTLPGGTEIDRGFADSFGTGPVLFDVAYDPWPSALAAQWQGTIVSGLEMLVHQALAQVRVFVGGSPLVALPDEPAVLAAMRAAVA